MHAISKNTLEVVHVKKLLLLEEFANSANAPIKHLFNCHTWCDTEWCCARELDDATHKIMTNVMLAKIGLYELS